MHANGARDLMDTLLRRDKQRVVRGHGGRAQDQAVELRLRIVGQKRIRRGDNGEAVSPVRAKRAFHEGTDHAR